MNYQARIEKLRERFLRANTKSLFESACVEGGAILIQGHEKGVLRINEELVPMIGGTRVRYDTIELMQACLFRNYALCNTHDHTFRMVHKTTDVSVLSERFASFCLELAVLVDSVPEDVNSTKYLEAIKLWNNNPELSWADIAEQVDKNRKGSPAFSKAVERFAKSRSIEMKKRKPGMRRKSN